MKSGDAYQEIVAAVQRALDPGADVDTGVWMNLETGRIQLTQNFRPYKAAKYIKSDDSFFQIAQVKELCVYPGDVNPRIRWEGMTPRPLEPRDLRRVGEHSRADFATVIKVVKTNLKGTLSDKQPIYALNFRRIGLIDGQFVVEDAKGERLTLTDAGMSEVPASCHLLQLLPANLFDGRTLVARFRHDLDTRKLQIKPLSIVTDSSVVRLTL